MIIENTLQNEFKKLILKVNDSLRAYQAPFLRLLFALSSSSALPKYNNMTVLILLSAPQHRLNSN